MELLPEVAEYIGLAAHNGFDVEKLVSAIEAFVAKRQLHADKEAAKFAAHAANNAKRAARKKPLPPKPAPDSTAPATKGLEDKVTATHQALLRAVTKEWVELKCECDSRYERTWRAPTRPTPPVLTGNRLEQVPIMRAWLLETENA